MSRWIRKDDRVVIIAGNDKGKVGTVLSCLREKDRVIVSGVNIRKKHVKRTQENQTAQIIELERPIHVSNVNFCDVDGKSVSIKVRATNAGGKELYYINQKGKETVLRQIKKRRE